MDDEAPISLPDATSVLRRALFALATGDVGALELFTEDVSGDSPNLYVRSRTELGYQLIDRAGGLSNVEFDLDRVVMDCPDTAVASWRVIGDHTGEVLFNEDIYFPPTGRKIRLTVTTYVQFRQRQIAAFRTSYDNGDLFDQIRSGPPSADRALAGPQPGSSQPAESQPGESQPDESQPDESQPGESQPDESQLT